MLSMPNGVHCLFKAISSTIETRMNKIRIRIHKKKNTTRIRLRYKILFSLFFLCLNFVFFGNMFAIRLMLNWLRCMVNALFNFVLLFFFYLILFWKEIDFEMNAHNTHTHTHSPLSGTDSIEYIKKQNLTIST